jgi:hypothetical protein
MAMQQIGQMSLKNDGGFVARIQFAYLDDNGNSQLTGQSNDIPLGQSLQVDPGKMGVPDQSMCWMHVYVVWGTANQAQRAFMYSSGNTAVASYQISGTTLANDLGLMNVG